MIRSIVVAGDHAARRRAILAGAEHLGLSGLQDCHISRLFHLRRSDCAEPLDDATLQRICQSLLVDPVCEQASLDSAPSHPLTIEVAPRAGVTDVVIPMRVVVAPSASL